MPLYDAWGRLLPDSSKSAPNPEAMQKALQDTKTTQPLTQPPRLSLGQKLKRPWAILLEILTVIGVIFGFLALRTDISVDPSVSYDAADPFSQRFVIANNGLLSIQDVHYGCAITHISTGAPQFGYR